jgi:hypothetical protein
VVRRTIAIVGGLLVLILLVWLVNSCFDSRNKNAIKDYANNSAELLRASKVEGDGLFQLLQGQGGADRTTAIINQLNGYRAESATLVDRANRLDVPGDLKDAQGDLLEVLEFRRDGLAKITDALRVALGDQNRREGSDEVAKQMQVFLASDVVDTLRFRPELYGVLNDKDLSAPDLPQKGFVPDIQWLQPDFVADQVNALRTGSGGSSSGSAAPGTHGNGVAAVTLGGVALASGGSSSVTLAENLAFEVQVQNQGENTENDVTVTVTVGDGGDADTREKTIDTIAPGEIQTVTIPLDKQPPTGQNVPIKVTVKPVPGEQKTDNNTLQSSVIFTR